MDGERDYGARDIGEMNKNQTQSAYKHEIPKFCTKTREISVYVLYIIMDGILYLKKSV